VLKAETVQEAAALGWRHTTGSTKDIYLTLRGLLMSDISPKELHGPINIAKVAYQHAGMGLPQFVLFLGLISINLAVINFLPIPVLDGGHMVFLLWEGLARRRPNERVVAAATYCGLFFVLGLMVFVIYQDIFGH
jgi:regulator of sigma E protease